MSGTKGATTSPSTRKTKSPRGSLTTNINLLQLRNLDGLTSEVRHVVELLTLDPKFPAKIVGSSRYKIHKYPADIDLFNSYTGCCTMIESIEKVVAGLRKIALRIEKEKYTYLADFKAGEDERYKIDVGTFDTSRKVVIGFNANRVKADVKKLHCDNLITSTEHAHLLSLVKDEPNFLQHSALQSAIKEHYVLRWTLEELKNGYKMRPNDTKITLGKALIQKTIVKIDVWSCINGRFTEVTNWFYLKSQNNKGVNTVLSKDMDNYLVSLKNDISEFKNPELNKQMKLAKRLWLYAVNTGDENMLNALYPLFMSGAAKLYQVKAEIETLRGMLDKLEDPPLKKIYKQVEQFKERVGSITDDILPNKKEANIYEIIDNIVNDKDNINKLSSGLKKLEKICDTSVDKYAKKYIRANVPVSSLQRFVKDLER